MATGEFPQGAWLSRISSHLRPLDRRRTPSSVQSQRHPPQDRNKPGRVQTPVQSCFSQGDKVLGKRLQDVIAGLATKGCPRFRCRAFLPLEYAMPLLGSGHSLVVTRRRPGLRKRPCQALPKFEGIDLNRCKHLGASTQKRQKGRHSRRQNQPDGGGQ